MTEKILRELSELWVSLGEGSEQGVLRACAMTLIVVAEESDDPAHLGETLAALMREHPSRAIVLRVRLGAERALEAKVLAQCWTPFGKRQQICCEQIEITAGGAGVKEMPAVLRGLLAPDLPVVLWCRVAAKEIEALFPLAAKLIFDSDRCGLERIRQAGGADLNWARLTPWRRAVAQIFEHPEQRAQLAEIREVTITHRGAEPSLRSYYLAAWLRHALGRAVECRYQPDGEKVTLGAVEIPDTSPPRSDYELLREELSIPGRDTVYDEVLRLAIELAGRRA